MIETKKEVKSKYVYIVAYSRNGHSNEFIAAKKISKVNYSKTNLTDEGICKIDAFTNVSEEKIRKIIKF